MPTPDTSSKSSLSDAQIALLGRAAELLDALADLLRQGNPNYRHYGGVAIKMLDGLPDEGPLAGSVGKAKDTVVALTNWGNTDLLEADGLAADLKKYASELLNPHKALAKRAVAKPSVAKPSVAKPLAPLAEVLPGKTFGPGNRNIETILDAIDANARLDSPDAEAYWQCHRQMSNAPRKTQTWAKLRGALALSAARLENAPTEEGAHGVLAYAQVRTSTREVVVAAVNNVRDEISRGAAKGVSL